MVVEERIDIYVNMEIIVFTTWEVASPLFDLDDTFDDPEKKICFAQRGLR